MKTTKTAHIFAMIIFPILYGFVFYFLAFQYLLNQSGEPIILHGGETLWFCWAPLFIMLFVPGLYSTFCLELAGLVIKIDPEYNKKERKGIYLGQTPEERLIVMKRQLDELLQNFYKLEGLMTKNAMEILEEQRPDVVDNLAKLQASMERLHASLENTIKFHSAGCKAMEDMIAGTKAASTQISVESLGIYPKDEVVKLINDFYSHSYGGISVETKDAWIKEHIK